MRAAAGRSPQRRRPRARVNRASPPPVDRSTAPGPGRRHQRVVARMTGHPPPAPARRGNRRAAACSRCPAPALPCRPPLARAGMTRPARRGLARHQARPAARPVLAVRRPLPARPWAHRPQAPRPAAVPRPPLRRAVVRTPLFRRAVIRIPSRPAVIPTPCRRCAVRTLARRPTDPARSSRSSPAVPGPPPTAPPSVDAPSARPPTRRGPPEQPPPPGRPASTAHRLASCRRLLMACGPTPPSTLTRVPPGVVPARPTPARPSPPGGAPPMLPVRQRAGVAAPRNPTSRWCPAPATRRPCPARGTRRRCPRRPARTAAPYPLPAPPTAPVAAESSPVNRNAERHPAANPAWTGRSDPRTGSARPVACHTPTLACRSSTAETAARRPGVAVRRRPPGRETSPTRRPVGSPCPTRPRSAPPPAGPPVRRSTRARTRRPVAAPSGPTRRDPPESRR